MAYQYKKSITIDHTLVSADLSNFPVLVSITDNDLRTVANGGYVQNSNGFDIIFMDSTETTQLDHEIELYTAMAGAIVMWVRVPSLSSSVDTVIYVYFGDASITTSQENVTGVWDSNYKAVYHLKESSGTSGSIIDSTSNGNDATPYTTWPTTPGNLATSSGKIGGAQSFNGTTNGIRAPASSSLNVIGQHLTISAWIKRAISSSIGTIVKHGTGGVGGYVMALGVNPATINQIKATKYGVADLVGGAVPADTEWNYVIESGSNIATYIYVNGVQSVIANNASWRTNDTVLDIGTGDQDAGGVMRYFAGAIDEVRISNIARSQSWITTEYNNQNDPSTFYAVGATVSFTTTSTRTIPSTAALLLTSAHAIPSTVALRQTITKTIPSTVALQTTEQLTITSTAALMLTSTHTIASTAALLQTGSRTITCTAALSAIAPPETNATFYVRGGDATFYTRLR